MDTLKKKIDREILKYLKRFCDRKNILYKAVKYAVFPGGKRIRPVLCLEACIACGGDAGEAMPAASALEFIHSFSLVHDDLPCMDDDDYRRGALTCHKKFGEASAVLAGDALLALAFETAADIKNAEVMKKTLKQLAGACGLYGIIGGQELDVKYEGKKLGAKVKTKINDLKTGALFTASLKCGAYAALADERKINALESFGYHFGRAFQIRDDIEDKDIPKHELSARYRELEQTVFKAKSALDNFGKKADNLRYLVEQLKAI